MDHTIDFDVSAESIYAIFRSEEYWQRLVAHYLDFAQHSELVEFSCDASGIEVEFHQVLARSELPSLVRTVVPLDLVLTRRQHFGPFDGDRAHGTYTATVAHVPGRLDGHTELRATDTGSTLRLASSCKVGIPLLGGPLETLVLQAARDLFGAEEAFTADWLVRHR